MSAAGSDRSLLTREDADARGAALVVFDRPLVLVAGAGTGKTTTLVARILAWCLGPGWYRAAGRSGDDPDPEEVARRTLQGVVAITFTEAAAAEMSARAARELARVAAGRLDEVAGLDRRLLPDSLFAERLAERARRLLGALDHLTVRTIHAWCLGLLLQHPMEAGLHPALAVDADGAELEALAGEVVEARLEGSPSDERLRRLAARRLGPREIARALVDLAQGGLTAADLAIDPVGIEAAAALSRGIEEAALACSAAGARALAAVGGRATATRDAARATIATAEGLDTGSDGDGPARLEALRAALGRVWSDSARRKVEAWSRGRWNQQEEARLGSGSSSLRRSAADLRARLDLAFGLEPRHLDDARRVLRPLAARLETAMAARGLTTFAGLLREAARLLDTHPQVRRSLRRRLDQLLVDEVQDTDGLQCEIVRRLALEGDAAERPGLCLVGDPKQSIYGWRNADLEAYETLVAAACEAGGVVHHLHRNFRSVQPILDEVSRVVGPVMVETAGLQPPFAPLVACDALAADPGHAQGRRAAVEHWVSWAARDAGGGAETLVDDAADLEASAVAADLRDLHDRDGVAYRSCALLLRSTGRIEVFLDALRRAGVPFAVARDRSYYRRREVIEAAALVRAVISPHDRLALAAVLRSPLVGVPDAALLPLWRADLPGVASRLPDLEEEAARGFRRRLEAVARAMPPGIPGLEALAGWPDALLYLLDRLAALRLAFAREPADRFLAALCGDLLLESSEASRTLGRFRLANLERFFVQLEEAIDRRGGDVQAILRVLRRSVEESLEAEEAAPKQGAEDAVQVLSIHGAKGLEFDHVYLAQLHATPGGGGTAQAEIDPRREPGAARYSLFRTATPDFSEFLERRRRVAAAEQVRTLYVAMTRAKRRLVMIGRWPADATPRPWLEARSHLELLAHRSPPTPDLAAAWSAGAPEIAAPRDPGTRWCFPALHPTASAASTAGDSTQQVGGADDDPLARARDRERERGAARMRSARPLTAAPSLDTAAALDGAAPPEWEGGGAQPEVARAVGLALHRALETWRLGASVDEEAARQHGRIDRWLAASLQGEKLGRGRRLAAELLERWVGGPLLPYLVALAERVVGREIPLLAPAAHDAEPLVATVGTLDLLYRSPEDGRPVVVDFKTDRVERDEAATRARLYAGQAEAYRRAVAEAMGEPGSRAELWFLWPGIVVRAPAPPAAANQSR